MHHVIRGDEAEHAGMRLRPHPLGIHPVVAYALGGLVGGAAALLWATNALDALDALEAGRGSFSQLLTLVGPLAFVVVPAGVVAGWLVVALILSRAPGRIRCPRCGTPNERDCSACRACDYL